MSCSNQKRTHAGWSQAETDCLFSLAASAQVTGLPLKAVFDQVAESSGRRPNSVRNYYYARVKESDDGTYIHQRAFQPFSEAEAKVLVEQVLTAQAGGESVRSCTLRLAGGDDKAMLRYQNKYRALMKNNPTLIRQVAMELESSGRPSFDPYAESDRKRRAGRPRKQASNLTQMAEQLAGSLQAVDGATARGLLESLLALATAAERAGQSTPAWQDPSQMNALRIENDALRRQMDRQHERYKQLLGYFTQLIRINSEFLSLNSVVKVSNLSSYIHDLESKVKTCEQVMTESAQ